MPTTAFPITGGAQKHPLQHINNQQRVNVFPTTSADFGRGDTANNGMVIVPTAGLLEIANTTDGLAVRANINIDDTYQYSIIGSTVYSVSINELNNTATLTSLGDMVGSATSQISWANNRTQIMVVDGTTNWGYIINYIANTLTKITDPDFTGGSTVVCIDSYFFYNQPGTQTMWATEINDGTNINALDTASAESRADNLVALLADKNELLAFGTQTIEFWYDSANATGFPFSRRPGEYYNVGCSARGTPLSIDNTVFFLDHRRYLSAMGLDGSLEILSKDPWIRDEFASYSTVEDAQAYEFQDLGHLMYILVFPTAGKCWAYDLSSQKWHERAEWNLSTGSYNQHRVSVCTRYKGTYWAGDYSNGKLYFYSSKYRDDNGTQIRRFLTSPYIYVNDSLMSINSLYLLGHFGTAPITGTGSDPQIALQYSSTRGVTWSNEVLESLGKTGGYHTRVKWYRLGTEREWLVGFCIYEPIDFAIAEMGLDIEVNNV